MFSNDRVVHVTVPLSGTLVVDDFSRSILYWQNTKASLFQIHAETKPCNNLYRLKVELRNIKNKPSGYCYISGLTASD